VAGRAPVALSRDGYFVAAWEKRQHATGVWDLPSGKLIGVLKDTKGHPLTPYSLAFDRRGELLAALSEAGSNNQFGGNSKFTVSVHETRSLSRTRSWQVEAQALGALCFDPAGQLLAATVQKANYETVVQLWNVTNGAALPELPLATRSFLWGSATVSSRQMVDFSADGQALVAAGDKGNVKIWRIIRFAKDIQIQEILSFSTHPSYPTHVALSPDGRWLGMEDWMGQLQVREARSGLLVAQANTQDPSSEQPAAQPLSDVDSLIFLAQARRVWNFVRPLSRTYPLAITTGERNTGRDVTSLAFSPDDRWLAFSGLASGLQIIDLRRPDTEPVDLGRGSEHALGFSSQSDRVCGVSLAGPQVVELPRPKEVSEPAQQKPEPLVAVAFAPGGDIGPVAIARGAVRRADVQIDLVKGRIGHVAQRVQTKNGIETKRKCTLRTASTSIFLGSFHHKARFSPVSLTASNSR
jgi:WD40 repeat protein